MKTVTQLQKKRAENLIWNAAGDYGFQPDFKAYDSDGKAEVYWNCIIGAVRRQYDYPKLEQVFASFEAYEDADTYEGLLWLGLENSTYARELADRPVLQALRREYAERYLRLYGAAPDDYRLLDCLSSAHYRRVLGREVHLSRYDIALLDELEFSPELDTDEIVERAHALFEKWFQINTRELARERKPFVLPFLHRRKAEPGRYRQFGAGFADHPKSIYGGAEGGQEEQQELRTSLTAEQLREFMEGKYGLSLFSPVETKAIERELCTGNHAGCHLLVTKGARTSSAIRNGFEALHREQEALQIEKNRRCYRENLARSRAAEQKLAAAIENSVLLHLQPSPVRANVGELSGGRVWRAVKLNDERVFARNEQENMGDLSVDILLDASTSQKDRQETVSNQGYLIARALTRCAIPCRVMSFCSMTGYTILRVFRDYDRPSENEKILEYVANGCNRDGLAIRAARYLMKDAPCEHRLLIVLSDVKPNDIVRIPGTGEEERIAYEKDAGLRDTALEVRRARSDGIAVVCVFTGDDEDVPSARLVYGRDFARIQSLDRLADTVGLLIRSQIRNL